MIFLPVILREEAELLKVWSLGYIVFIVMIEQRAVSRKNGRREEEMPKRQERP